MAEEGSGAKLATAYYELIPSMKGAEGQITAGLVPAAEKAGMAGGSGIGSMLLGGLKKYAAPIAALAAGWSIGKLVESSDKAFDGLADTTRQLQLVAGGTAEQVSGMSGAMQLAGVDSTASANSIKIFNKNLGQAATSGTKAAVMSKLLGGNFLDAAGNVKPMADLLPGVADKFQSMPDGAQKTALALQLFGRSGQQLIPFLNQGAAGLAKLTAQAKTAGLVVSQSAETDWWNAQLAQKAYTAAVTGTKAALGQDLAPVMDSIAAIGHSVLTPVLNQIAASLNALMPKFTSGAEVIEGWASKAGGAVTAFLGGFKSGTDAIGSNQSAAASWGAAAYGIFSKVKGVVLTLFDAVKPAFQKLAPVFASLIPQVLQLVTSFSPLHLIFTALAPVLPQLVKLIANLAAALGGALGTALKAVLPAITVVARILTGSLTKVIQEMLPVVAQLAQQIGGTLSSTLTQLAPVIGSIAKVLGGTLGTVIKSLMPIVLQLITYFMSMSKAFMPLSLAALGLLKPILQLVSPLLQLIGPILKPLVGLLSALLKPILQLIVPLVNLLVPILVIVTNVLSGLIGWIAQGIQAFVDFVTGQKNGTKEMQDLWKPVLDFFEGMWKGIDGFFANGIKGIVDFFTGLPKTVTTLLSGAGNWLVNTGKDLINGLLSGAGSILKNIGKFFLTILPSWIVAPFKAALGIHSPSTVMAEQGAFLGTGLVQGVTSTKKQVTDAMTGLVSVPALNTAITTGVRSTVAASTAAPANFYVQNPFTGEYLLAKVSTVATAAIAAHDAAGDTIVAGGVNR